MARRVPRRGFVRLAPRTKMWIGAGIGAGTSVANSNTLFLSLFAGALALRPFTILRTRMIITIESDQFGVTERPSGDYGRIVVEDQAVGIGATAIPSPVSDPEADWFVYQPLSYTFLFVAAGTIQADASRQYLVDSKAMRKVDINQDIAGMIHLRGSVGAIVGSEGRTLIQLH